MDGYIPLNRTFFEHELWLEEREFSRAEAFVDLLRRSRFEAAPSSIIAGAQTVEIRRGEMVVSIRSLAKNWRWPKSKVARFLDYLVENGVLTKRMASEKTGTLCGTLRGTPATVVKFCNLNDYNDAAQKTGTPCGTLRGTIIKYIFTQDKSFVNIPPYNPPKGGKELPPNEQTVKNSSERKEKVAQKRKELDLSFVEPSFQPIVADWLLYKSERGQTYRQRGAEACYKRLFNLSGGDADKARRVVEQSKANNWAGLFELKEAEKQRHGNPARNYKQGNRDAQESDNYDSTI